MSKHTIHTSVTNGKFEHEAEILEMAKRFEAKRCKLVFTDSAEEQRTIDQNKGLWRWDKFLGNELGYTAKEMHYAMCGEIFGWYEFKGKGIPRKTTRDLTKAEWQDYIRDYERIAGEQNVVMPPFGKEEQ